VAKKFSKSDETKKSDSYKEKMRKKEKPFNFIDTSGMVHDIWFYLKRYRAGADKDSLIQTIIRKSSIYSSRSCRSAKLLSYLHNLLC
jgi:hypothetical protein